MYSLLLRMLIEWEEGIDEGSRYIKSSFTAVAFVEGGGGGLVGWYARILTLLREKTTTNASIYTCSPVITKTFKCSHDFRENTSILKRIYPSFRRTSRSDRHMRTSPLRPKIVKPNGRKTKKGNFFLFFPSSPPPPRTRNLFSNTYVLKACTFTIERGF